MTQSSFPDGLPRGISIVVPVFNSENTLVSLVDRLQQTLGRLDVPFEIILVNDASRDGSWSVIERLAEGHPSVLGINLMRNYGQHNALLCGTRSAHFDVTVTIDDDLQNPPEEIGRLVERLNEGYDVVYGTPERQQHGLLRDLASTITKFALQSAMGIDNASNVSAFRVFRTQLRQAFEEYRSPFVSLDVLLTYGARRLTHVQVGHEIRKSGTSNYTFLKLVTHAVNTITSFSPVPLQIATLLGFAMTTLGILILIWVVGRYIIIGGSVPGFPFLASIIAIFSGTQMFALGIIGEYLARIHVRSMDRPPYTVRQVHRQRGKLESS